MSLTDLAPELIYHIYQNLSTVADVINFSLTCRHFNYLLRHSQKLTTLFAAAEREFGPLDDIFMLITYNKSQQAHVKRTPPISYALLRQVIQVGTIGKKIEELYPSKRWRHDYMNRRSISQDEAYRVRRAVYRIWLYSDAFHNSNYPRTRRLQRNAVDERAQLLRNWTTQELAEIQDVHNVLEDVLSHSICPTDGAVQRRVLQSSGFLDRPNWPSSGQPRRYVNVHNMYYSSHNIDVSDESFQPCEHSLPVAQLRKLHMCGWGDDIGQYHVVQSMLKLTPAQIVRLYEYAYSKSHVESLVFDIGEDWFWNNGQTWTDTWTLVLHHRGEDVEEIRDAVLDGYLVSMLQK